MLAIAYTTSQDELAKILWYYNLIPDTNSLTHKIICPFHADVNPSMVVNLQDDSWFCFGCGLAGDAFKFVKILEADKNKLNDLQAYRKFLQILKSNKSSEIKLNNARIKTKNTDVDLFNEAHDYYYGLATVDWDECDTRETQQAKLYMLERGFTTRVLQKCRAKITYNKNYGIVFPMFDNGEFKGWVCRTMIEAVEKKRKYLYNEGFSRASTLVGDYGSREHVFVVEGYMDRLKFLQYGINNVVAILGWKMSQQQINKLKDAGVSCIISALDNDECGAKGTEYLKKYFDVVRFSYIKGVKDPGDMSSEMFTKMYNKTMHNYKLFLER